MTLDAAALAIDDSMREIHVMLSDLGTQMRALRAVGFFGPAHLVEMSRQLEGVARRALTADGALVAGAGVAWETGADRGQAGMLWWRADQGEVTQKIHVDNPDSDSFYDFMHSEWYTRAVESSGLVVVGPFIDAWGTDDHTLTPAIAVHDDHGVRLGIAAADLDVSRTTARLLRVLSRFGSDLILVNGDDHVVAANDPVLTPGLRLEPFLARRGLGVIESAPVPVQSWRVQRVAEL